MALSVAMTAKEHPEHEEANTHSNALNNMSMTSMHSHATPNALKLEDLRKVADTHNSMSILNLTDSINEGNGDESDGEESAGALTRSFLFDDTEVPPTPLNESLLDQAGEQSEDDYEVNDIMNRDIREHDIDTSFTAGIDEAAATSYPYATDTNDPPFDENYPLSPVPLEYRHDSLDSHSTRSISPPNTVDPVTPGNPSSCMAVQSSPQVNWADAYSLQNVTESFVESLCPGETYDDDEISPPITRTDDTETNLERRKSNDGLTPSSFHERSCADVFWNAPRQLSESIRSQVEFDIETLLGCGEPPTDDEMVQVWRKDEDTKEHPPQPPKPESPRDNPMFFPPLLKHKRASLSLHKRAEKIHRLQEQQTLIHHHAHRTHGPPIAIHTTTHSNHNINYNAMEYPQISSAKSMDESQMLSHFTTAINSSRQEGDFGKTIDMLHDLFEVPPVEDLGKLIGQGMEPIDRKDDIYRNDGDDELLSLQELDDGYDSDPGDVSFRSALNSTDVTAVTAVMGDLSLSLFDQDEPIFEEEEALLFGKDDNEQEPSSETTASTETNKNDATASETDSKDHIFYDTHRARVADTALKVCDYNQSIDDPLIEESFNSRFTLRWHPRPFEITSTSIKLPILRSNPPSPEEPITARIVNKHKSKSVHMWMERGTLLHNGEKIIEPKLMFRQVEVYQQQKQQKQQSPQPHQIRLLSVCRIMEATPQNVDRNVDPLVRLSRAFVIKTCREEEFLFEASTETERNDICQLWKHSVARLASLAVVGDEETMITEFFASMP